MTVRPLILLVLLGCAPAAAAAATLQSGEALCNDWQQCRQLALAAADRGEYETFHDLAWRAVQTGPRNDPALMYLLARAQALSGRAHDALVMLQRLADIRLPSDAATNDDFISTRQLPGWPELAARIEQSASSTAPSPVNASAVAAIAPATPPPKAAAGPNSGPAPAPTSAVGAAGAAGAVAPTASTAPTPAAASGRPPDFTAAPISEAVRFSTRPFALAGFAYDVVSRRFLFGDRLGRKLIVVGEGSSSPIDLVRADSAGFHDIAAIEVDEKRGDLWVASSGEGGGTLHRLQLVSGRPLRSFPIEADEPVKPADLAVTAQGSVVVLDSAGPQLLMLRPSGTSLDAGVRIDVEEPSSLAAGGDERTVYVAHRDGLSRVDLQRRKASRVTAPKSTPLPPIERIRWYRNALVAIAVDPDGSRRIVRLDLNAGGSAITRVTTLESSLPSAGQTSVTISGDELLYLVSVPAEGHESSPPAEFVGYRVRLR